MKAIVIHEPGGPEVLKIEEVGIFKQKQKKEKRKKKKPQHHSTSTQKKTVPPN